MGIAPEKTHLIFDSFTQADAETTRKYGGSGLGLSICRELVRKMGGNLLVTSQPGKGSSFYFTIRLPFQLREMILPKEKLESLEKLSGVKVLLAEDNAVNRKIAMRFLKSWGAAADMAENGQIAWDLYCRESYDIVLIDLEMPVMDGKQPLSRIRASNKNIPPSPSPPPYMKICTKTSKPAASTATSTNPSAPTKCTAVSSNIWC
ncbi:MAG: ATP-binding protein [Paludibaculum sp.]